MEILKEIIDWSLTRPDWQRDALRRLVTKKYLGENDFLELTQICKSSHQLAEKLDKKPLKEEHLPIEQSGTGKVIIKSICHQAGVNALAENQILTFNKGLNVYYGNNGAGKSGYTRIIKKACKARGHEEILGNIFQDQCDKMQYSIRYSFMSGTKSEDKEWTPDSENACLTRIGVFDTKSSREYLTKKTDISFRPFGIDLFDKLVQSCEKIEEYLNLELKNLKQDRLQLQFKDGTKVHNFFQNLSLMTSEDELHKLSTLSETEQNEKKELEKIVDDLNHKDPDKIKRLLQNRSLRIEKFINECEKSNMIMTELNITSIREKQQELQNLKQANTLDIQNLLNGTGCNEWKALWETARKFSESKAYIDKPYPVIKSAQCVLCQQDIDTTTADRLCQLEKHVKSDIGQKIIIINQELEDWKNKIKSISFESEVIESALQEFMIDNIHLAEKIREIILKTKPLLRKIINKADTDIELEMRKYFPLNFMGEVRKYLDAIKNRLEELNKPNDLEKRKNIKIKIDEYTDRELLNKNKDLVLQEIRRHRKIAALERCLNDVKTHEITKKSSQLTEKFITKQLQDSFSNEVSKLKFPHEKVKLEKKGGAKGVFYHQLILKDNNNIELTHVVSEGEARCLALAEFLAELNVLGNQSAIVFDDPVSSLDHNWRKAFAERLVEEAKDRQVIIFTHDITFIHMLNSISNKHAITYEEKYLRSDNNHSGIFDEDIPWIAQNTNKRIGFLNKSTQNAEQIFNKEHNSIYEATAREIYGYMREAWERAVEEVLLNGVITRFNVEVHTKKVKKISDISIEDYETLEKGMSKCSLFIRGHDQPSANVEPVPTPEEIKEDIAILKSWVKGIRDKRK